VARSVGDRIAEEALSWRDTPFTWGQSQKGVGCDCKGLLAGVFRELGLPEADSYYAAFSSYRVDRPVPAGLLLQGFEKLFDRVDAAAAAAGDILLLKFAGAPAHMAIHVGNGRAVHAYHGHCGRVRERDLAVLFHKFPLHSVWRTRHAD
jgi:cell wall-associated NlpC family hydrolase